jgi:hypothetical protein
VREITISARHFCSRGGCEVCGETIPGLGRKCADHHAADVKARGGTLISCIRYYPNGDYRREDRAPEDLDYWISYNRDFRFGNSLFVEGKCVQRGVGFTEEECSAIEHAIANNKRWIPGWQSVRTP